jgi:hypothetical protein
MPSQELNLETRMNTLHAVLTTKQDQHAVDHALRAANGDMTAALSSLKDKLSKSSLQKLALAHTLADLSNDNEPFIKAVAGTKGVTSLRDVALTMGVAKLAALVDPAHVPIGTKGKTSAEKARNFAITLQHGLFAAEPTAVLHRMVEEAEIPIADTNIRTGVVSVLTNLPDFNIRTTSVYTAFKRREAFKGIPDEHRAGVVDNLKTLQRVQAISPVPEAVPVLMKANLTSAYRIAEVPESTFLKAHSKTLGEQTARQVYTNAINAHIRNEHALITMRDTLRGTGLAIIDGKQTIAERVAAAQAKADEKSVPLNLSTLFGSLDYCECEDCLSVYSPASYFVELLQFLRNNDLGPDPANPTVPNPKIHPGIVGTPVEMLFRRRPDLQCLELTCDNTFTILPYIDLVNEVMESFVVHTMDYHNSGTVPKQVTLEAFNVEGETSSELLAIPQHINYEAYCILKSAVYPFTLPYHQPIDATRIFLNYLGTSRWELLDTFRSPTETCPGPILTPAELQQLQSLHQAVIDRAIDADFLGMTQEEYIILTQEAFWPKAYFELTQHKTFSDADYQKNIGVRQVCEYYGYIPPASGTCDPDMQSADESTQSGLTFVKTQFLRRTGLQYTDLVDLLKTRFVNPVFPQGQALATLESIPFSYQYLQTLVDKNSKDPAIRFAKLIELLETLTKQVIVANTISDVSPCAKLPDRCVNPNDIRDWVICYFERIGHLIVLESGEGPRLPFEGELFVVNLGTLGTLHKNGTITKAEDGSLIGRVSLDDQVLGNDGKPFFNEFISEGLIRTTDGKVVGLISKDGPLDLLTDVSTQQLVVWQPALETCDLNKVRLVHLDGSSLAVPEYDRIQRFIRLWRKLGWTIDETDKALNGLAEGPDSGSGGGAAEGGAGGGTATDEVCEFVGFDTFVDDCAPSGKSATGCGGDNGDDPVQGCPDPPSPNFAVTPDFLHQLRAVKKLLDQTGLPLSRLLAFWADISTDGEESLYSNLFLTHNLLGIDTVFEADVHGNYLTQTAKISDHIPVLMAALKLKADDITAIMSFAAIVDSLTLPNVSILYRYSLLGKILNVRIPVLKDVVDLFGNPFQSAWSTLALLETWGKMEDAGFTFRQLDYLILDRDDAAKPLAPSQKTILQLTKTIFDGLNAIDHDHPDITSAQKDDATDELIRTKAALLFDTGTVEQILALLDGTTVYTTNAPAGLTISIPDTDPFSTKLKYSEQKGAAPPVATIQVIGILTDPEVVRAKALSNHPNWPAAIDRVGKQSKNVFNDVLAGIFIDKIEVSKRLLVGDFTNPADPQDPANTAPDKRFYFLQQFLPFLRQQLSQRLIVDTAAAAAGLPGDVMKELLFDVLHVGTPAISAIDALQAIKDKPAGAPAGWSGYLIPAVDADFSFVATGDTQPPPLTIDGQSIPFTVQQEDPSNVWSSDPAQPVKLKSGKLYLLQVTDRLADNVKWKTMTSPPVNIPSSSLLPDFSSQATSEVFTRLYKAALVVNGFSLSADEISYLQSHGAADFDGLDFNGVTLAHWLRLQAYADLRDNLPRTDLSLIGLFTWTNQPAADVGKLSMKIAAATGWKESSINQLIAPDAADSGDHFDLNRLSAFHNEINLIKLRQAIGVADKIAVDVDRLFDWAKPGSKFWACHLIAEDIRKATRARFDEDDWEQVVKPLNDQLRENQKQALISYLLVQPDLLDWGAIDADSLFEFFLIDVQMGACMETSRIKQAISSVQLFIQRCLLGLEEQQVGGAEVGVRNDDLDRDRWEWMQRYRLWEANRKVFLYPENWIKSELRDDKSQFYKELESELLQKDINPQTVEDALKGYLFKVDAVANLQVVGVFVDDIGKKLHVVGRTRNAPFFFFHRYFDTLEQDWYPWEKVQVDIPSYESGAVVGRIQEVGAYIIPVVWNNRLLLFFPQFLRKTLPLDSGKVDEFWEIKLGWTEYRNDKWTQKQLSGGAVYDTLARAVDSYQFVPRLISSPTPKLLIEVFETAFANHGLGAFQFAGSQLVVDTVVGSDLGITDFHYQLTSRKIGSLQAVGSAPSQTFGVEPYFTDNTDNVTFNTGNLEFFHPFSHQLLGTLASDNLDDLFAYYRNSIADKDKADAFGASGPNLYNELKAAYSIYNWEAAFHAPMLLVDRLAKAQQFEQALKICGYVLDPFAAGDPADPASNKRFWQFSPFKTTESKNVLENLFLGLDPGQPNTEINDWRNKPFQPHAIARLRPAAYMKWVAMTYIRTLIEWGDYLFRQDTIESINQATQIYVLAAHLYGPKGQKIPKRGKVLPETYYALIDKWDAFGNAMVELELAFPFSNQGGSIDQSSNAVELPNIFGFASTLYFCIPDNPDLTALRDTIDDRLFKIRHCEDIAGVFRQLPLFEPPIDPALLVQAAAQGLSLSSVLNDLNSPIPNYRFAYLLQKALEMCNELKALGNAFLSAREKGDVEALARLRASHESNIQSLVMEVRKQQLEEAGKALDALQQSRKGPEYRLQHYLSLIGESAAPPDVDADFKEIADQIEVPLDEGGLRLISYEKEEMDKASEANDKQEDVGSIEVLAGIFHAIPNVTFTLGPVGSAFGGSNLGSATQAVARSNQVVVGNRTFSSTNAARKASFLRQLQDRVQQANVAGYEIKNIDKQALTQQIRINIAQQEITNQQQQIDNAEEVEDFLRSKYSSQELYTWMTDQLRALYYQSYTLAYDLGKRAEKLFRFERGLKTSNFIQFGYWDPGYDGLLSGERLFNGLKQLEAAYQEERGHDFEIAKSISLRQLDPLALLQLRETGSCEFAVPEVLFDMDYPGHYMRRIKSVGLRIPCVLGAYTSLNCTLRLLEHKFRTSSIATGKNDYPERTDGSEDRFSTTNVPITAIAVSSLDDESGVFELNFHDERYLPFEGAGGISKWRIELPDTFRQFDYDTMTDVVMRLRITSMDAGDKLKQAASDAVLDFVKSVEDLSKDQGLFASFDLKNDFSNVWYMANHPPAAAVERVLTIDKLNEKLPIFTKSRDVSKVRATDLYLFVAFSKDPLPATAFTAIQDNSDISFDDGPPQGTGSTLKCFVAKGGIDCAMDSIQIKISDTQAPIDKMWMVHRYTLT